MNRKEVDDVNKNDANNIYLKWNINELKIMIIVVF